MEPRSLEFSSYDEIADEIDRLHLQGYEKLGEWDLGQTCQHLSYYLRGSLEGYPFLLPWLVRKLIGRPMFRRLMRTRRMPVGGRTIPESVPPAEVDEKEAAEETKRLLAGLRDMKGDPHPSPIFDRLTPEECRTLHLMHCAHHLRLLIPKDE